ncbi:MAG: hypothetical protein IKN02_05985 [Prevotella sp.]|nr:hypothetical protein [Prevotella sp.]
MTKYLLLLDFISKIIYVSDFAPYINPSPSAKTPELLPFVLKDTVFALLSSLSNDPLPPMVTKISAALAVVGAYRNLSTALHAIPKVGEFAVPYIDPWLGFSNLIDLS